MCIVFELEFKSAIKLDDIIAEEIRMALASVIVLRNLTTVDKYLNPVDVDPICALNLDLQLYLARTGRNFTSSSYPVCGNFQVGTGGQH